MPSLSMANNLELADSPADLCDLNVWKRHLIAECIMCQNDPASQRSTTSHSRKCHVCDPSIVQEAIVMATENQ